MKNIRTQVFSVISNVVFHLDLSFQEDDEDEDEDMNTEGSGSDDQADDGN